eukprot:CAMPEP_0198647358 /NCGR_PEP_ID=MMETSP1467-20131203/2660_1 /TAXON_ID=1462469 /ORGANISM="unid. sp., Strain CCMP2135" /LENGTH=353 /DNA_ID=CAMNT_0044382981 /DNA_START=20 /DNA_END=1078 /DNA_ORIENTATION=-
MGSGASQQEFDKAAASKALGRKFDAKAFDALAQGHGKVVVCHVANVRGKLGVTFDKTGCVTKVQPGSVGEKKGVQKGWKCLRIGDDWLRSGADVNALLAKKQRDAPNKTYALVFSRAPPVTSESASSSTAKEEAHQEAASAAEEADRIAKENEEAAREQKLEEEEEARKREEEERRRRQAEEEEERRKKEEEERKARGNGMVKIVYEMYDEEFAIADGKLTAAAVDDVYCLSYVCPDCKIHLSPVSPTDRTTDPESFYFLSEDPSQTFVDLEKDATYYAYVKEDPVVFANTKKKRDANIKALADNDDTPAARGYGNDGSIAETCSCIYGNPCVDEYGCRDWTNRFAVAKANGW